MRRSTRWTSGRALCRTLRRWFPFSFFSLFLSLLLLFFFSAFSSILVSRPLESSPFGSVITATLYRFFLSLGTGLVCRSSGPTWRTRRHFTRREETRNLEGTSIFDRFEFFAESWRKDRSEEDSIDAWRRGEAVQEGVYRYFPNAPTFKGRNNAAYRGRGEGGMFLKPTNRAEASLNMLWNQENPDRESCNPCSKSISRGNDLVEKVVHE